MGWRESTNGFQKMYFKIIIIGGTAGWFTVGTGLLLAYLGVFGPSKENRLLFVSIAVVIFIIGACIGNLLLKKTRLRWLVE